MESLTLKKSNGSNLKFDEFSVLYRVSFGYIDKINSLMDIAFSSFLMILYPLE